MTKKRILSSRSEIIRVIQDIKKQRKQVVAISGSFDILHLGHIRSLEKAKSLGDTLVVLLNSDESVRAYKGSGRPINSQTIRSQMLLALKSTDYIVLFDEITPKSILAQVKPDIYCQGSDWGRDCIERETVEKYGGKIYVLRWTEGFSTTDLIDKILKFYSKPQRKAVFLDRDGTINIDEPEYLHRIEDFKFTPNAIPALQKLSTTDYHVIIVTNQSGVGRGYYKRQDVSKLHKWLTTELKRHGVRIDHIYYCTHSPEDNCPCRKPHIGMLRRAVEDYDLSLAKSWVIGDDECDVIMAREANVKSVKIGKSMNEELKLEPNFYAKDLLEAVEIILSCK